MTCAELSERLDRYHAGVLPREEAEILEQHLLTCESCRSEFRFQRGLRAEVAALPRSLRPAGDLWSGIQARISSRRVRAENLPAPAWWQRRAFLAAAAIILMALASSATAFFMRQRAPTVVAADSGSSFRTTEAAYREAADELAAALERRRASLGAAQIAVIEHNLRIIDEAIRETQAALAEQPGNRKVVDLLWASYEKKIDLLQRAASSGES